MEIFGLAIPVALALIGFTFLCLETLIGDGTLFIAGSAMLITGFVGLSIPNDPTPLGLAATLGVSVIMMYFCYQLLVRYFGIEQENGPTQTTSSDSLEGRTGVVIDPVDERDGTVELDSGGMHPVYQARTNGAELDEGEEIIVVEGGGGNVVTVASVADETNLK